MEERRLSDFIDIAIQREIEAVEFYRGLCNTVQDTTAREALDFLANEERKHREFLESLSGRQAGARHAEAHAGDRLQDRRAPRKARHPNRTCTAVTCTWWPPTGSRTAVNFYTGLAAIHPDGQVKEMLLRMAGEEKRHKEKVEYLYSNTAFPQTDGG